MNSFGISGTNVHVILDAVAEAPETVHAVDGPLVLPISARSDSALRDLATAYRALTADASPSEVTAICSTAATGRSHLEHRLAVVGRTGEEITSGLDGYLDAPTRPSLRTPERGPVFVFSGQGSQWEGMGLDLMDREPVFRAEMEACDDVIKRFAGWSLLHELAAGPGDLRLDDNAVLQPAILAIQLSLAALWRSWGIEPAAVVGYSMGEVAAACVAGVLSRDDAIRIITSRGEIMQRLAGTGGVLMVQLSEEAANAAIQELSEELRDGVQVAILLDRPPRY